MYGILLRRIAPLALLAWAGGCGDDPAVPDAPGSPQLDFSGSWNPARSFGGPFGHDGHPVQGEHFIVYSGTASQAARQYTLDVAEQALEEILDSLDLTPAAFDFLPSYPEPKIHILAIKDQDFGNNSGFAYRDGLVVISREAPQYTRFGFDDTVYKRLIKHESTHVVEFLLIGTPQYRQASEVWWREGFAHYLSRPRPSMITTRARVEEWRESHASLAGLGNPVAIRSFSDFPQSILAAGQTFSYYDLFELTVRYLLDPRGFGASAEEVIALYDSMGQGVPFQTAMEQTLGLDVRDLELNYWDIILTYLDSLEV